MEVHLNGNVGLSLCQKRKQLSSENWNGVTTCFGPAKNHIRMGNIPLLVLNM